MHTSSAVDHAPRPCWYSYLAKLLETLLAQPPCKVYLIASSAMHNPSGGHVMHSSSAVDQASQPCLHSYLAKLLQQQIAHCGSVLSCLSTCHKLLAQA